MSFRTWHQASKRRDCCSCESPVNSASPTPWTRGQRSMDLTAMPHFCVPMCLLGRLKPALRLHHSLHGSMRRSRRRADLEPYLPPRVRLRTPWLHNWIVVWAIQTVLSKAHSA